MSEGKRLVDTAEMVELGFKFEYDTYLGEYCGECRKHKVLFTGSSDDVYRFMKDHARVRHGVKI